MADNIHDPYKDTSKKQTCSFLVTLAGPSSKALICHLYGERLYIKESLFAYKCYINGLTKGPHKSAEKKQRCLRTMLL